MSYKKSEDTKNLIMQTAGKLFYEKGYHATTVREIALVSGLSLSRLNYHFAGKDAVAATICKQFLKSLDEQVVSHVFPLTNQLLLKDVIHIRLILKAFISLEIHMKFYYEIICENILSDILVRSSLPHFKEQFEYCHQTVSDQYLQGCSHVFTAALVEFIKCRHEGDPNLSEEEFLDVFNDIHLKQLNIPKNEREDVMQQAKRITGNMYFQMETLSCVKIRIKEEPDQNQEVAL